MTRIRYSLLETLTGSDLSRRRLPFMLAQSAEPGPVVWLTACGHGDEVGGIVLGHADSSMVFPGMRIMAFGMSADEAHRNQLDCRQIGMEK